MRLWISTVSIVAAAVALGCSGAVGENGQDGGSVVGENGQDGGSVAVSGVVVSVSPKSASLLVGASTSYTATVTGTTSGQSTAVTWSVQESGGGTVDGSGRYTAPGSAGTYHVVATSVADPTKSGTAQVVVSVPSSIDTTGLIPPDRVTVWKPGVPGGIPSYSHVFATIDASTYGNGTTDATAAINSALASAGAAASAASPQVVMLPAGTYLVSALIILDSSYVVLRGAGPTQTR